MTAFLTWLGNILAGYGVTEVLTWLGGKSEDEKWAALYGQLYEIRQLFGALLGDVMTSCPQYWSVREALEDNEVGLTAAQQYRAGMMTDLMATTGYGTGNLYSLLVQVLARLIPGEDPPPLATTADTSLILACLYYLAQYGVKPFPSVDNSAVLDAIGSAKDDLQTSVTTLHTATVNGFSAADADLSAIQGDTGDILAAVAGLGDGRYPGAAGVVFGEPHHITGPTVVTEAVDGVIYTVNAYPSGQSRQPAATATRYKGLAWLSFFADDELAEPRQALELGEGIVSAQTMEHATGFVVFCKLGSDLTVTGWVKSA